MPVDYIPGTAINTHPALVLAAAESFWRMCLKCVVVAEGPEHQRDTQLVLSASRHEESLARRRSVFVELNRDELVRMRWRASYTGMKTPGNGASCLYASALMGVSFPFFALVPL